MGDFELIWAFCAHLMHIYGRFEIYMRDSRNRASQPDPWFFQILFEILSKYCIISMVKIKTNDSIQDYDCNVGGFRSESIQAQWHLSKMIVYRFQKSKPRTEDLGPRFSIKTPSYQYGQLPC